MPILVLRSSSVFIFSILSCRVIGINVLFSRVIQGCLSASSAVYRIFKLNFVSLWNKLAARGERWSGKLNCCRSNNYYLYFSVKNSSDWYNGCFPPVSNMYMITPTANTSTPEVYYRFLISSGDMKIRVPTWSVSLCCSYLALSPKSATLIFDRSSGSAKSILSGLRSLCTISFVCK